MDGPTDGWIIIIVICDIPSRRDSCEFSGVIIQRYDRTGPLLTHTSPPLVPPEDAPSCQPCGSVDVGRTNRHTRRIPIDNVKKKNTVRSTYIRTRTYCWGGSRFYSRSSFIVLSRTNFTEGHLKDASCSVPVPVLVGYACLRVAHDRMISRQSSRIRNINSH